MINNGKVTLTHIEPLYIDLAVNISIHEIKTKIIFQALKFINVFDWVKYVHTYYTQITQVTSNKEDIIQQKIAFTLIDTTLCKYFVTKKGKNEIKHTY